MTQATEAEREQAAAALASEAGGLMQALLAFQAEAPKLQRDAINPHFRSRYISLESLMGEVMPLLTKHGLVWITKPCRDENGPALTYKLIHAVSGELEQGTMPLMLAKSDPQGQGSALTYARRYSLMAVLGLVADEDDDGNHATAQARAQPTARPAQQTERPATAKQRGLIFARAGENNMPSSLLAKVVLLATGNEPREFDSEDAATDWLNRSLDRLPASAVDKILEGIAADV